MPDWCTGIQLNICRQIPGFWGLILWFRTIIDAHDWLEIHTLMGSQVAHLARRQQWCINGSKKHTKSAWSATPDLYRSTSRECRSWWVKWKDQQMGNVENRQDAATGLCQMLGQRSCFEIQSWHLPCKDVIDILRWVSEYELVASRIVLFCSLALLPSVASPLLIHCHPFLFWTSLSQLLFHYAEHRQVAATGTCHFIMEAELHWCLDSVNIHALRFIAGFEHCRSSGTSFSLISAYISHHPISYSEARYISLFEWFWLALLRSVSVDYLLSSIFYQESIFGPNCKDPNVAVMYPFCLFHTTVISFDTKFGHSAAS